jgi:type VI protein secretion system component VasK
MNEVERYKGEIGPNEATADWLNNQYQRIERGTRLLLDTALGMGEVLAGLAKVQVRTFADWLQSNTNIPRSTAYQYISLYNYRNQIAAAGNLQEAYRQIETLEAQKKQTEAQKARQRVEEYKKTGAKPEGWRRGTDDKMAKEDQEREKRINDHFEEVKRRVAERQQEQQRAEAEREQTERDIELLSRHFAKEAEAVKKRAEFKEKIRLSADGMKDPFQDAVLDYLEGLENDSRRIEACYNIIKICKRIAVELQGGAA